VTTSDSRGRAGEIRWTEIADTYLGALEGPYHANRLDMVRTIAANVPLRDGASLDFGCGDGVFMTWLADQGAKVLGADINGTMIEAARERLAGLGANLLMLEQGGVSVMSRISDGTVDSVFALNVLAYLESDEEDTFYRETRRILRPGGQIVVTHSNELFDMFTFNRYTVDFFTRHFAFGDEPRSVASLLAHPDKPDRQGFAIRENPLSYRFKLADHGFREEQQEFAILHALPPLLTPEINFDDINQRRYPRTTGWPERDKWKLMFACSIFGSRATRL
jgi:SAM-dependent methyltransferase